MGVDRAQGFLYSQTMDTIFDNPTWAWRLLPAGSKASAPIRHDVKTHIVRPGDDEPEVVQTVLLTPPSQTFFFLRENGVAVDAKSRYRIVLRDRRAYLHLCVEDVNHGKESDWSLFYWTRSSAPGWLKKYLPAR